MVRYTNHYMYDDVLILSNLNTVQMPVNTSTAKCNQSCSWLNCKHECIPGIVQPLNISHSLCLLTHVPNIVSDTRLCSFCLQ